MNRQFTHTQNIKNGPLTYEKMLNLAYNLRNIN